MLFLLLRLTTLFYDTNTQRIFFPLKWVPMKFLLMTVTSVICYKHNPRWRNEEIVHFPPPIIAETQHWNIKNNWKTFLVQGRIADIFRCLLLPPFSPVVVIIETFLTRLYFTNAFQFCDAPSLMTGLRKYFCTYSSHIPRAGISPAPEYVWSSSLNGVYT